LQEGVACTYEIVIDGLNEKAVTDAMAAGIRAACGPEIICISAGNYGGKLGAIQFHLQQLLAEAVVTR
jgi:formylmethanofuran--tetrahydromethanopterin N-formyltransferase